MKTLAKTAAIAILFFSNLTLAAFGHGGMPQPPASELPRVQTIREGTVTVLAEDPASGKLVWRGSVSAEGRVSSNEAALRQIADVARHIAREFPARHPAT
jgi:hypothetical protein